MNLTFKDFAKETGWRPAAVDRNDPSSALTAHYCGWDMDSYTPKAQVALNYLDGSAFLFQYKNHFVVTDESGDLTVWIHEPCGAPRGVFDSLAEVNAWLEQVTDDI